MAALQGNDSESQFGCSSAFTGGGSDNQAILGDPFLRKYFTTYSYDNVTGSAEVGVALARPDAVSPKPLVPPSLGNAAVPAVSPSRAPIPGSHSGPPGAQMPNITPADTSLPHAPITPTAVSSG